jgi:hypothetical protein
MILFSIINKKITAKKDTYLSSKNFSIKTNDYFYVRNFEIFKNFFHVTQRKKDDIKYRQFFKILSGQLILCEDQEYQNFLTCNYYSNLERINLENTIEEIINTFLLEDFTNEKFDLTEITNKVCEFIEIPLDQKHLPIENFSTGFIKRIIYSIPFFLNYDLFIFSSPDNSIDETFKIKIYEKILSIKNNQKTIILDFNNSYLKNAIDTFIDFRDYNDIRTYHKNELDLYKKSEKKSFFYLSDQNNFENNIFQSSEKIKIIFQDKKNEFKNCECLFKVSLFTVGSLICQKKMTIVVKSQKFCLLEIKPFYLTATSYFLKINIEILRQQNNFNSTFEHNLDFKVKNDFRQDLNNKEPKGFLSPKIEWIQC